MVVKVEKKDKNIVELEMKLKRRNLKRRCKNLITFYLFGQSVSTMFAFFGNIFNPNNSN